jgi:hypothetical protein
MCDFIAVQVPHLSSVRSLESGPVLAVALAMNVPPLASVHLVSRPVLSVELSVKVPLIACYIPTTVGVLYRWSILTVDLSVQAPHLVSVVICHSRNVNR